MNGRMVGIIDKMHPKLELSREHTPCTHCADASCILHAAPRTVMGMLTIFTYTD